MSIINPKTNRPIKIGGRIWLRLVNEGVIPESSYEDPKTLYTLQEDDDEESKIQEINETLPSTQQAVRGRGKYNGKLVVRNKQPSTFDTARTSIRATAKKVRDPEIYDKLQESDDFEEELERMIMEELANISNEPRSRKQDQKDLYEYHVDDDQTDMTEYDDQTDMTEKNTESDDDDDTDSDDDDQTDMTEYDDQTDETDLDWDNLKF